MSKSRRIALWFLAGSSATFVVLAVALKTFSMSPTGGSVVRLPLWRYYLREWPRMFDGVSSLGPGAVDHAAVLSTTFQHVALSLLGGLVVAAIAWGFQRR